MMKQISTILFTMLLVVCVGGSAIGQITLTMADVNNGFLNAQRTQFGNQYSFGAYPTKNLGNASSSSQNFDFSTAPPGDTKDTLVQNFVSPSGLPGASNFPGATIGFKIEQSPFPGASITFVEFWSIENDGVYGLGSYVHQSFPPFLDTVVIFKFMPKRLFVPLPLTYGTSRTHRDTVINDASTGEYEVRTTTFNADGFGSITFPPNQTMPVLSKSAGGEQCIRVLVDAIIDVYDGGNNLIGHGHNRDVNFVGQNTSYLDVTVTDTAYTSGPTEVSGTSVNVKTGVTGVQPLPAGIPENFTLSQNYPNPFNPTTKISFAIPSSEYVTLKVFDLLGREVATLINENLTAGAYTIDFDGANLSGGIYFYRMTAGNYSSMQKMSLIK